METRNIGIACGATTELWGVIDLSLAKKKEHRREQTQTKRYEGERLNETYNAKRSGQSIGSASPPPSFSMISFSSAAG